MGAKAMCSKSFLDFSDVYIKIKCNSLQILQKQKSFQESQICISLHQVSNIFGHSAPTMRGPFVSLKHLHINFKKTVFLKTSGYNFVIFRKIMIERLMILETLFPSLTFKFHLYIIISGGYIFRRIKTKLLATVIALHRTERDFSR